MKRLMIAGAIVLSVVAGGWIILAASGMGGLMLLTALLTPTDRIDPQAELQDLAKTSDPNRRVPDPQTRIKQCMLMHAASDGTSSAFRELLRNGADPSRCEGGIDRILDALLLRAAIERFQGNANTQVDKEFIEVLCEFKVRPNDIQRFLAESSRRQSTAGVIYAAKDLGADVNHVGEHGNTPLHWALKADGGVTDRSVAVVDVLVKLGADPNAGLSPDKSSLSWARTYLSERNLWPQLEAAMLQKQGLTKAPSNNTIERDARKSGARPSL